MMLTEVVKCFYVLLVYKGLFTEVKTIMLSIYSKIYETVPIGLYLN